MALFPHASDGEIAGCSCQTKHGVLACYLLLNPLPSSGCGALEVCVEDSSVPHPWCVQLLPA